MNKDFDVMIVGGGPAGLSTWLHLNKYTPEISSKTIIIEKSAFPREKICGGGLGAWCQHVLKHLDIKLDIPIVPISNIEFVYNDETFNLHQENQLLVTKRSEFDNQLVENGPHRGLTLNENEYIIDFKLVENAVKVETNKDTYMVKILVGADGSLSQVRRLMKLDNVNHLAPTIEVFSPSNSDYDREFDDRKVVVDLSYIDDGLQGYFWHVPSIHDTIPMIGHGMVDFRILKDRNKADMKNIFKTELKTRNISIAQPHWLSHPIRWYGKDDMISKHHVFLVGDAVGIEPAFGGGIHFALSYGNIAAKAINHAFDNFDFSFLDYKERIDNHLIGKFIRKCEHLGKKMFSLESNPIDVAKELFTLKKGDW